MEQVRGVGVRPAEAEYAWGDGCLGWRLVDRADLSVVEERVPPGRGERWHVHDQARQLFHVLDGQVELRTRTRVVPAAAGESVEVPPGVEHQLWNAGDADARFLVVSAPSTRGDRRDV